MSDNNITDREQWYERYDRGGNFIDDYELKEPLLLGYRWLNLPAIEDLIDGFAEEMNYSKNYKVNIHKKENDLRRIRVKKLA